MKLTIEQEKTKKHFNGPALVLAVPGAGKTTVLLNRIIYLIKDKNINPKKILALTFSKAQATDMKERFLFMAKDIDIKTLPMFSTIHAFSYYIIRYYLKINKQNLTVIEGSTEYNKFNVLRKIFLDVNKEYVKDEELETFFTYYSYIKNSMIDINETKEQFKILNFNKIYIEYEKFKREHHFIDFDDMVNLCLEILLNDEKLLNIIQNKFSYIQLDEGQDTSLVQMELIKLIARPEDNLFIVADDDQSIYGFRGANPKILLDIDSYYPNCAKFFIEENHRSTKDIVKISNKFIKKNISRYDKEIYTNSSISIPVSLVKCKTIKSQYKYILKTINKLEEDSLNKSIAILYRNNISALGLMNYFDSNNIDFHNKLQKNDFLNHKILFDVLDIIAFSENQTSIHLFEKIYYKLNAYIKKNSLKPLNTYNPYMNIFDRLLDEPGINDFYMGKYMKLKRDFKKIEKYDIPKALDYIFFELGYGEYIKDKSYLDEDNISLNFLIEVYMSVFENCKSYEDMVNKIDEIKAINKKSLFSNSNIILSTVHQSKGLEYDTVFVIDLVDGEFPMKASSLDYDERREEIEEERRLFYVAMTRAKYNLYLIAPTKRNFQDCRQSRFYTEVKKLK